MTHFIILLISFLSLFHSSNVGNTPIENFHQLNDSIYRSAQPSQLQFDVLDSSHFKSILNLRCFASDKREARHTGLLLIHQRISAPIMNMDDVLTAMINIKNAPKPLLIHCKHGSDRTGVVIAFYRMIFESWSKEKALAEFLEPQYGYNAFWFPGLKKLIQNAAIEKLREEVYPSS